ncbi:hypothetical protein EV361DRAFT_943419 [Lentinula raphanica]|nr:hypothetical protein EV361DRAFT_943419 [Lentinula raphanica]
MMWLRVRPVFLWRLSLPTRGRFYTNKEWRKMLDAVDGKQLSSSKGRAEMLHKLKEVVKGSRQYGIDIDDSNIASAPALWKGSPVLVLNNGMPERDVVQAAVWELYEINFRLELIMLDRELLPEPVGDGEYGERLRHKWMEREVTLNQCWPGLPFRPDISCAGLSSYDGSFESIPPRIPFLKAFHQVIQSWPGEKPSELVNEFPAVEESNLTPIRDFEAALANYYVRTFLKTFHRPAILPHYIS